jgi:hypothetical protein
MATTNYGWDQPTVGGDEDTWGDELNDTLEAIDIDLKAVADAAVADAAMVKLTSATAALNVSLPAGYRAFKLLIIDAYPVADADAYLRFNFGSGVLSGASDYYWSFNGAGGGASGSAGDALDSEIELTFNTVESTNSMGTRFEIDIVTPVSPDSGLTIADFSSSYQNFGPAAERMMGRGVVLTQTVRSTAVQFLFSGTNISKLRWVLTAWNGL